MRASYQLLTDILAGLRFSSQRWCLSSWQRW